MTLIELMIVVVIVAIMAAIAIGGFNTQQSLMKADEYANRIPMVIASAKSEAAVTNSPRICRLFANGIACFAWADAGTKNVLEWADTNGSKDVDAGDAEVGNWVESSVFDTRSPIDVTGAVIVKVTGTDAAMTAGTPGTGTDFLITPRGMILTPARGPANIGVQVIVNNPTAGASQGLTRRAVEIYSTGLVRSFSR